MILGRHLALPFLLTLSLHAIPRLAFPLSGAYLGKVAPTDRSIHTLPRSQEQTTPTDTHLISVPISKSIVERDTPSLPIGNDPTL